MADTAEKDKGNDAGNPSMSANMSGLRDAIINAIRAHCYAENGEIYGASLAADEIINDFVITPVDVAIARGKDGVINGVTDYDGIIAYKLNAIKGKRNGK